VGVGVGVGPGTPPVSEKPSEGHGMELVLGPVPPKG
jgi:hypothetical protein